MNATATLLLESSNFNPAQRVDEKNRVIRGVKVLGLVSNNTPDRADGSKFVGRRYTPEALQEAVPLYEGVPVYIAHPDVAGAPRDKEEPIGWLEGVHFVPEDGLRGDLHYVASHPRAASLVETATRNPKLFSLSHNAHGDAHDAGDGWEEIGKVLEVHSVDLVRKGATTRGLFEAQQRAKATQEGGRATRQSQWARVNDARRDQHIDPKTGEPVASRVFTADSQRKSGESYGRVADSAEAHDIATRGVQPAIVQESRPVQEGPKGERESNDARALDNLSNVERAIEVTGSQRNSKSGEARPGTRAVLPSDRIAGQADDYEQRHLANKPTQESHDAPDEIDAAAVVDALQAGEITAEEAKSLLSGSWREECGEAYRGQQTQNDIPPNPKSVGEEQYNAGVDERGNTPPEATYKDYEVGSRDAVNPTGKQSAGEFVSQYPELAQATADWSEARDYGEGRTSVNSTHMVPGWHDDETNKAKAKPKVDQNMPATRKGGKMETLVRDAGEFAAALLEGVPTLEAGKRFDWTGRMQEEERDPAEDEPGNVMSAEDAEAFDRHSPHYTGWSGNHAGHDDLEESAESTADELRALLAAVAAGQCTVDEAVARLGGGGDGVQEAYEGQARGPGEQDAMDANVTADGLDGVRRDAGMPHAGHGFNAKRGAAGSRNWAGEMGRQGRYSAEHGLGRDTQEDASSVSMSSMPTITQPTDFSPAMPVSEARDGWAPDEAKEIIPEPQPSPKVSERFGGSVRAKIGEYSYDAVNHTPHPEWSDELRTRRGRVRESLELTADLFATALLEGMQGDGMAGLLEGPKGERKSHLAHGLDIDGDLAMRDELAAGMRHPKSGEMHMHALDHGYGADLYHDDADEAERQHIATQEGAASDAHFELVTRGRKGTRPTTEGVKGERSSSDAAWRDTEGDDARDAEVAAGHRNPKAGFPTSGVPYEGSEAIYRDADRIERGTTESGEPQRPEASAAGPEDDPAPSLDEFPAVPPGQQRPLDDMAARGRRMAGLVRRFRKAAPVQEAYEDREREDRDALVNTSIDHAEMRDEQGMPSHKRGHGLATTTRILANQGRWTPGQGFASPRDTQEADDEDDDNLDDMPAGQMTHTLGPQFGAHEISAYERPQDQSYYGKVSRDQENAERRRAGMQHRIVRESQEPTMTQPTKPAAPQKPAQTPPQQRQPAKAPPAPQAPPQAKPQPSPREALLEAHLQARALCDQAGIARPSQRLMEALVALPTAEARKGLLEEIKATAQPQRATQTQRPGTGHTPQATISTSDDFLRALTGD